MSPRTRALYFTLVAPLALAACRDDAGAAARAGDVPTGAVAVEALAQVSYQLTIRDVGTPAMPRRAAVDALVADSAVELAATDASLGIVLSVDNFDPGAPSSCHPNAIVRDARCADRAEYPYFLLDASPVLEVYLDGDVCVGVPSASAAEAVIDDMQRLVRLRAIAPVFCGDGEERTLEITVTRPADVTQATVGDPMSRIDG
ncbi:MAG: hypothetical protein H6698_06335 [Myxococcales bacterium]|nr:hypothetical protein [Myxococcales bacterium]MCB9532261.1 hypothetical protein [Myxococcales bacterium]MCB9533925.1 hypothetical protein [Myxococcales bacterium]